MPRISVVAKNYAKALFGAANKNNSLKEIAEELENFKRGFTVDFARELKNPVISKKDSSKIINDIAKNLNFGKVVSDFLVAVTRNKRLNLFPEIYEEFNRLKKIQGNILEVELISAKKLTGTEIDKIKSTVSKKYSGKIIEVKETIKNEILGGLQIKIGSNLIDASLKSKLSNVERELIRSAK